MVAFSAKTTVFEGPLETLLGLIEERKLSISEVSLAQVADDFIAYAKRYEKFPMAESANFILTAATLLLIKSKSLLPSLALTSEEQGDIKELTRRLALYQKVRARAGLLRAQWGTHRMFLPEARERAPVFTPDAALSAEVLLAALRELLKGIPSAVALPRAIVEKVASLDDMIVRLTERLTRSMRLGFREFSGSAAKAKKEIILSFLALLELVRRGRLRATQEAHCDDILMEHNEIGVPKYQ